MLKRTKKETWVEAEKAIDNAAIVDIYEKAKSLLRDGSFQDMQVAGNAVRVTFEMAPLNRNEGWAVNSFGAWVAERVNGREIYPSYNYKVEFELEVRAEAARNN